MTRTPEDIYDEIQRVTFVDPALAEPGSLKFVRLRAERDQALHQLWAELAEAADECPDTPAWALTAARTLSGRLAGDARRGVAMLEAAVPSVFHGPLNGP